MCKPIVLLLVSVLEAIIYDLHDKIQTHTREGVRSLPKKVTLYIQGKTFQDYSGHIASCKKHKLLGDAPRLYEKLDELRRLRNRIHIQNEKGHFDPDESDTFTIARKRQSEKTAEHVLKYCSLH